MTNPTPKKQRTHRKILEEAAKLFKSKGFDGAGVDSVMQAAGLTHGGFYAHFDSKSALMAETVALSAEKSRQAWLDGLDELTPDQRVQTLLMRYLNAPHCQDPTHEAACPFAAMGADIARADDKVRETGAEELAALLSGLTGALDDAEDERAADLAAGFLAAAVGGVMLARILPETDEAERCLRGARLLALRALRPSHQDKDTA